MSSVKAGPGSRDPGSGSHCHRIIDIIDVMASITIRNLHDSVKEALRQRAAANQRSMEEEARFILGLELRRDRSKPTVGLGTRIAKLFEGVGVELEIPPRELPRKPPFLTDEEWEGR